MQTATTGSIISTSENQLNLFNHLYEPERKKQWTERQRGLHTKINKHAKIQTNHQCQKVKEKTGWHRTSVVAEYGRVTAEVAADSSDTDTVVGAWCRQVLHCRWHADMTDTCEIYWRRHSVVVFYDVVVNGTWLSPR